MKNAKGLGTPLLWPSPVDSNGDLCQQTDRWLAFAKIVIKADFDKGARMKTTLDLEPELYEAAERLAQSQKKSLGQVVSELLRRSLSMSTGFADASVTELERHNGFDVFPERAGPKATVEAVQQLCREEGI